MSKREYVRQELADIEDQVAGKDPGSVGEDMSDLAALGLARYNPTITPVRSLSLCAGEGFAVMGAVGTRLATDSACPADEARRPTGTAPGVDCSNRGGRVQGQLF